MKPAKNAAAVLRLGERKNHWRAHTEKIVADNARFEVTLGEDRTIILSLDGKKGELRWQDAAGLELFLKVIHDWHVLSSDVYLDRRGRGHGPSSDQRAQIVIEEWEKEPRGYQRRALDRMLKAGLGAVSPQRLSEIVAKYKAEQGQK